MTEQTLTQEPVAASPWRDGTAGSEKSAALFDEVVTHALHNSPESVQFIRGASVGVYIKGVVDTLQMETGHYEYLHAALTDDEVLALIDKLAERVRLVAEPVYKMVKA